MKSTGALDISNTGTTPSPPASPDSIRAPRSFVPAMLSCATNGRCCRNGSCSPRASASITFPITTWNISPASACCTPRKPVNPPGWRSRARCAHRTALDRDIVFDPGSEMVFGLPVAMTNLGSKSMRSEVARTAEAGYRFQSGQRWSVDTSVFWSQYRRLRSVDYNLPPELVFSESGVSAWIPMRMANSGAGRSYGGDASATVQLRPGWRLIPSYSYLNDDRWLPAPSANYATLWEQIPADIRHQGAVRLQYDVARNLQLDLMARARSRDHAHDLPGVLLADVRFSWHPVRSTEFAFTAAQPHRSPRFRNGFGRNHPGHPNTQDLSRAVDAAVLVSGFMANPRITRWTAVGLISLMAGMAGGATEPEDELKSATVLSFVRHSEWLQDSQSGPITIGVTGRPSMISTLRRTLDGKTANNRAIRIVDVKGVWRPARMPGPLCS